MRASPRWISQYDLPVRSPLPIPDLRIDQLLTRTAAAHPDYVATVLDGNELRYGEIEARATRFAHGLRMLGIQPGDRVALLLPNSPTYVIACYGALRAGAVLVNLNVTTHGAELSRVLAHTGTRVVVTLDLFLAGALDAGAEAGVEAVVFHSVFGAENAIGERASGPKRIAIADLIASGSDDPIVPARTPDDTALFQLTSGTTSLPKVVMLSHRNVVANVWQLVHSREPPKVDNGASLCVLPFFHVFGFTVCLHLSVVRGLRMVLVPRFDPTSILPILQLLERARPVQFPAVPSLWAALVMHGEAAREALSRIPVPSSGGAPLPASVQAEFVRLTGHPILEAYGLSEASSTTHMAPATRPSRPGSVGVPLPDTDARIVDVETGERELPIGEVGELIVRGPQIMQGYYRDPELTAKVLRDGWLYTGDLARMDEDGWFYLVDRKDDLIITSGYNVYPSEIESTLAGHPAVKEALAVGLADKVRGHAISAAVVLREGASATVDELVAHCRAGLLPYKVPRTIEIVAELPKAPTGKPLRKALRSPTGA